MGADQKFESVKDEAPSHHCNLSDLEVVHKIAQILLPGLVTDCSDVVHKIAQILLLGLVTACIDNTSSNCFKSPRSVAVDIRKEMVDYLTSCPFYHVCCHSSIPYCTMEQHCSEFLQSYLVFILKTFHKEAPEKSLNYRGVSLLKLSSAEQLLGALDVRKVW